MQATIKFPVYEIAKEFARDWSRKSLIGYSISPKQPDGSASVTIYKITDELKIWVEAKIKSLNDQILTEFKQNV